MNYIGYCIFRVQKLKALSSVNAVIRHNRREADVVTVSNAHINPKIIIPAVQENQRFGSYNKFFKERTKNQTVRKDAVRAVEVVMTFSPDSIADKELKDWLKVSADFVAKNFGGYENIYDIQFHIDELTPHAHIVLIPIDEKGKLNCRSYLGGASKLRALQDNYADEMKRFGLERGKDKRLTKAKHIQSLEWHKQNAENEARLKTYELLFGTPITWNLDKRLIFYNEYDKLIKQGELMTTPPKIQLKDLNK